MIATDPGHQLRGRRIEREALDRLVAGCRSGESQVLVLRGEPGVGKTALLDHLADHAEGCHVARTAGVESEMELAFAGLQQLCAPFLDRLERLPDPQRDALRTAFGLHGGEAPDRFLVGLAVLTLLCDVAEERPLVCVVDDAQWLDEASAHALAFVARRLSAEPVAMAFALREPVGAHDLGDLPELEVRGLSDADARALLAETVTGPLDERVRDRIVAETRGNPLALVEVPRGLTPEEIAGGFGLPGAPVLSSTVEQGFRRDLASLPAETRLLLLVAAAEPVGDPTLVWRAAGALGVDVAAAAPAAAAGLIEAGGQLRFRHSLVRSAVYHDAAPQQRQQVHRALADATDAGRDPDRRAWHRAHAAQGLDEDIAAELEGCADRARARGGFAAAAAFLQRATELTPDAGERGRRALAAAESKHQAGATDAALHLLATARAAPLDDLARARSQLLRAQVTFSATRSHDAVPLLLAAAQRLEPLDATLAREAYMDAFAAALSADHLAGGGGARDVAAAVLAAERGQGARALPRACDLLLDGLATLATRGVAAGAPLLRDALAALRDEPIADADALRWLGPAAHVARALGDDVAWDELTARQLQLARRAGALALLPIALADRFSVDLSAGRVAEAQALVAEADAVVAATDSPLWPHGAIVLAAWRGDASAALGLIDAARRDAERRGEGLWLVLVDWSSAILFNGLGRYDEALDAAQRSAAQPGALAPATWVAAELVEAAARSGQPDRAADHLVRLGATAHAGGTDWALGLAARSRALLSAGPEAERLYREAIERLERTRIRSAPARARLIYGEWLRREGRRVDAREQLRTAHEQLAGMGLEAFAERARRELTATGESVRRRTIATVDDLTPQEAEIARLAATGCTNPEIGAHLFLSPRTVEWHLRKVFAKLGVSSRRELRDALPEAVAV